MLLPYASDRPPRNPPIAVVLLVLINFAVFGLIALIMWSRGSNTAVATYADFSLVPGALRFYAPLTYAFLHADVFHLSVNMLFLWVFGGSVEDAVGWKRFLTLYLVAAVATGLLQVGMCLVLPGVDRLDPIVGASGAVSTVVGVFAVRFYRSRIRFIGLPFRIPAVALLALVLTGEMASTLWQILTHAEGSTAHWAHIGGFFFGMLWAQGTRMFQAGRREYLEADAVRAMESGAPLSAVSRWEAVLRAQPDNFRAMAELGRAWELAGDPEQGRAHFRRAIAGLLKQGDRPEAAAHYRQWVELDAEAVLDAPEQFAVANTLEEAEDYADALKALTTLLRVHPDAPETEKARLRIGVLQLKRLAVPERAVESLEDFLTRYPHSEWRAFAEEMLRAARRETSSEKEMG